MSVELDTQAKSQLFTLDGKTIALDHEDFGSPLGGARLKHKTGDIIDQKFKVLSLLGEGGMGAVYKVHHLFLKKDVALKTFRTASLSEEESLRFQREVYALSPLNHPNIVPVFDFGLDENNIPYYTMECLQGQPLAEILAQNGRLNVIETAQIFIQISDGLSFAHGKGIIHRDLKPGNIFIVQEKSARTKSALVKIVDFGLAGWTTASPENQKLTATGAIFGSPLYMSPEQSLGLVTDERTDIYSIGCALFECLTGQPPFRGANALATMMMHQTCKAPDLALEYKDENWPQRLTGLIARMLAKAPEERPQSFEEVASELQAVLNYSLDKNTLEKDQAALNDRQKTGDEREEEDGVSTNKRRGPALPIVALLILLLAVAGLFCFKPWQGKLDRHASAASELDSKNNKVKATTAKPETNAETAQSTSMFSPAQMYLIGPAPLHPTWKVYQFPNKSLGHLSWGPWACMNGTIPFTLSKEARNKVYAPPGSPMQLTAGKEVADHPEYLNGFNANDLNMIKLDTEENWHWSNKHFHYIGRLTGLTELDFMKVPVSGAVIPDIQKLKYLRRFSARFTKLTGTDLAKLQIWQQLDDFSASGTKSIGAVLTKMQHSQAITKLQLDECQIGDEDMKKIATMPNLKELRLRANKTVTDASLAEISGLKHLTNLEIDETAVTPKCIDTLKNFQLLRTLFISDGNWTPAQQQALTKALPAQCNIRQREPEQKKSVVDEATQLFK